MSGDWFSVSAPAGYRTTPPAGIRPENIRGWTDRHIQRRGLEMLVSYAINSQDRDFGALGAALVPQHGQTWPDGWRIEVLRRPTLSNLTGLQFGAGNRLKSDMARKIKLTLRPGLVLDSYRLPPAHAPAPFEVEEIAGWWRTETGATFAPGMPATTLQMGNGCGALRVGGAWRIYCHSSPRVIDYLLQRPAIGWDRDGRYWTAPRDMSARDVYSLIQPISQMAIRDWDCLRQAHRNSVELAGMLLDLSDRGQRGLRNRFGYDHLAITAIRIGSGRG